MNSPSAVWTYLLLPALLAVAAFFVAGAAVAVREWLVRELAEPWWAGDDEDEPCQFDDRYAAARARVWQRTSEGVIETNWDAELAALIEGGPQ